MGISNLLPFLENSTRSVHISEFRGKTVAVDTYCWLHKGAFSCAEQLVKGENSYLYLNYCLKYIKLLLQYDIQPIMVFDGRHLPAKQKTEIKRREDRRNAKKQAIEFLRLGKIEQARKYFRQCIDIEPAMALALIKECRNLKVECIVAPYESDAQLAFFNVKGIADIIITEDSDLLLFGCQKVLYKMDLGGSGQLVEAEKIYLSMKIKQDQYTFDKFRYMCILSGCDYLDSLPGIGLKKALKFITMTAESDPTIFLDRIPRYLNLRNLVIDDDYKQNFLMADATFKHQIVFDPRQKKLMYLNELERYNTKIEYCKNAGEFFDDVQAYQLCLGNLNPMNMERMDNWCPEDIFYDYVPTSNHYSLWTNFQKIRTSKIKENLIVKHDVTVNAKMEETKAIQYDLQLTKELEMYKEISSSPERENLSQQENKDLSNIEISPTIGNYTRNPFFKTRRISKFNMTEINEKVVVRSRFFSSPSILENVSENEQQEEGALQDSPATDITIAVDPHFFLINNDDTSDVTENNSNKEISQDLKKRKFTTTALTKSKKQKGLKNLDKKQPSVLDMFKRMPTS